MLSCILIVYFSHLSHYWHCVKHLNSFLCVLFRQSLSLKSFEQICLLQSCAAVRRLTHVWIYGDICLLLAVFHYRQHFRVRLRSGRLRGAICRLLVLQVLGKWLHWLPGLLWLFAIVFYKLGCSFTTSLTEPYEHSKQTPAHHYEHLISFYKRY